MANFIRNMCIKKFIMENCCEFLLFFKEIDPDPNFLFDGSEILTEENLKNLFKLKISLSLDQPRIKLTY